MVVGPANRSSTSATSACNAGSLGVGKGMEVVVIQYFSHTQLNDSLMELCLEIF